MSLFKSSRDIVNKALEWAGELPDVGPNPPPSEYREKAFGYLNDVYLQILSGSNEFSMDDGQPWPWAMPELPGQLILQPPANVVASMTNSSTAGFFSSAPTISLAGRWLKLEGWPDGYWIVSHNANETAFVVDGPWTGVTASSSGKAHALRYTLSQNILRLVAPMRAYRDQGNVVYDIQDGGEITMVGIASMMRSYPLYAIQSCVPQRFAIRSEESGTGVITVQFSSSVPHESRVEYEYIGYPEELLDSNQSVPIVPAKHRSTLAYGVAYYIAKEKDDDKRQELYTEWTKSLKSMAKEYHMERTNSNPRKALVIPRLDQVSNRRFRRFAGDY